MEGQVPSPSDHLVFGGILPERGLLVLLSLLLIVEKTERPFLVHVGGSDGHGDLKVGRRVSVLVKYSESDERGDGDSQGRPRRT